jgi:hypothetical protein
MKLNYSKILKLALVLFSIHSFMIGIGLVVLPEYLMGIFGFIVGTELFFPMQGGVFHIIMAVCYYIASKDIERHKSLVLFSIIVKFSATVFLLSYYLFINSLFMVFISGFVDLFMAIVLMVLYSKVQNIKD